MPGPGRPTRTILTFAITIAAVSGAPVTATTVDGTVRDSAGAGVPGIEVSLLRFGATGWTVEGWDSTAANGVWSIEDVRAGTYRLGLFDWSQRYAYEYHDDVTSFDLATDIEVAAEPVTIDAVVEPGGRIAGSLSTPAGEPLENPSEAVTGADGGYAVEPLFSGLYYVEFEDPRGQLPSELYDDAASLAMATPVQVSGSPVTGIDAVLDGAGGGPGGGAIAGLVTDETTGDPIEGIRVDCFSADLLDQPPCVTLTAADGSYFLGGNLPEAAYRVRFSAPAGSYASEHYDDVTSAGDATAVAVSLEAVTTGIDASLTAAGAIAGTVTDAAGEPLPKLLVTAYREVGGEWRQVASAMTFYEAEWRIASLEPGIYRVRFADGYEAFFGESDFFDDAVSGQPVEDVEVLCFTPNGSSFRAAARPAQPTAATASAASCPHARARGNDVGDVAGRVLRARGPGRRRLPAAAVRAARRRGGELRCLLGRALPRRDGARAVSRRVRKRRHQRLVRGSQRVTSGRHGDAGTPRRGPARGPCPCR